MELIDAKQIVVNTGSYNDTNTGYLSFDYVMNIYWGCNHGCIYCYARSDYYKKIGNFNDFDIVRAKKDALRIIRDDLRRKVRNGIIFTGGMSDPYNLKEREHKLTRYSLELINAFEFGVCVLTKSDLVTRDTDIMLDIKKHSPVSVNFSITCSDDEICKKIEPFTSTTTERFQAVNHLAKNGIITGVLLDPVIPFITDTPENVREIVKKAKYYGAEYIYISNFVTMSDGQREYFYNEAEKHFPGFTEKFKERYKNYYRCRSFNEKKLWHTFVEECKKEGINYDMNAANKRIRAGYNFSVFNTRK